MAKRTNNTSNEGAGFAVFIDRIEDGIAIITLSADDAFHFNLPLKYLPSDVKEGDHLTLSFETGKNDAIAFAAQPDETTSARNRVAELQAELTKDNDPNRINFKL